MDIHTATEICNKLNLGHIINPPKRIFGGLSNKLYKIDCLTNSYAIKHLSLQGSVENYELSEAIATKFKQAKIPTIEALKYSNKYLVNIESNYFIIYPWINAHPIDEKTSKPHILRMSKLLAQMHSINLDVPELLKETPHVHDNEEIIELIAQASSKELKAAENIILELNQAYKDNIPILSSNTKITHRDLDYKNILWDNKLNPIIIDWESVGLLNPAQELINLAFDWNGRRAPLDQALFLETINTYLKSGGIIDKINLEAAFAGTFGNYINWLVYNIKRSLNKELAEEREIGISEINNIIKSFKSLVPQIKPLKKLVLA